MTKQTKLNMSEAFFTIQGEGLRTGVPSVFIRTNGCNLACHFKNSICDTSYTSINPEKKKLKTIDTVYKEIKPLLDNQVGDIVITGGEPMMQQDGLVELIRKIDQNKRYIYTVETNGAIPITSELNNIVDLWSISPKLSSSCHFEGSKLSEERQEHHKNTRINFDALYSYVVTGRSVQFKFVWSGPECEEEIIKLFDDLYAWVTANKTTAEYEKFENNFRRYVHIMLMPEGQTEEQIKKTSQEAVNCCMKHGWRFTDRLHIRIWGTKRGV